ncbi:MAG TPA: hypothetical protein VFP34_06150 [Microlunatus sp.]|nr:hypothetical protein [Microlunatus sp.]
MKQRGRCVRRVAASVLAVVAVTELLLIRLGTTYGSTAAERGAALPGDDLVPDPRVITDHAITIDAPPQDVWPWLVQMGWHRGGWYTARWVDRLLFPANWPSTDRIIPQLQEIHLGAFIPDGPPETECGMIVEHLEPGRALALHSTSHLPRSWRERQRASLDWSWTFLLTPVDDGRRTRFHFRSRWTTAPWWLTLGGRLFIVPADLVMSRDMLRGVKQRAQSRRHTGRGTRSNRPTVRPRS